MACLTITGPPECESHHDNPWYKPCTGEVRIYLRISPKKQRHSFHPRCETHTYTYGRVWFRWGMPAFRLPL